MSLNRKVTDFLAGTSGSVGAQTALKAGSVAAAVIAMTLGLYFSKAAAGPCTNPDFPNHMEHWDGGSHFHGCID